ncbi:MAG TPA: DUF1059 domain-containing protein [Bacteroidota bacterium]|nr:DUF1059 domain-containing protein [Bacteroidota bacterium]
MKRIFAALFLFALTLSFSLATFAQDAAKQEMKKDDKKMEMKKDDAKGEMKKDESMSGPLKSVNCDATCGFMVRSHSEKEIISMVKTHAKMVHKMTMTDAKIKEMMKTEEATK